jgi:hypothetical protein
MPSRLDLLNLLLAAGGRATAVLALDEEEAPDPAPDLRGPVVDRLLAHAPLPGETARGTITVEDQCWAEWPLRREVMVTPQTLMLRLVGEDLTPADFEDLAPGERVEVWLTRSDHPFYPPAAPADFIVLARQ